MYGDAFPHETNMDRLHGVDFDKGCYVGQEVVSRMQHRGTARTRTVRITLEDFPPETGITVLAGDKPVGTMGSTAGGQRHGADPDRSRRRCARCRHFADRRRPRASASPIRTTSARTEADRRMSTVCAPACRRQDAVPVAGRGPVLHGLSRHRMGRAGI